LLPSKMRYKCYTFEVISRCLPMFDLEFSSVPMSRMQTEVVGCAAWAPGLHSSPVCWCLLKRLPMQSESPNFTYIIHKQGSAQSCKLHKHFFHQSVHLLLPLSSRTRSIRRALSSTAATLLFQEKDLLSHCKDLQLAFWFILHHQVHRKSFRAPWPEWTLLAAMTSSPHALQKPDLDAPYFLYPSPRSFTSPSLT